MDKEDVVYLVNEMLLSHKKKKWNNAICSHMDGPRDISKWRNYTQYFKITYMGKESEKNKILAYMCV